MEKNDKYQVGLDWFEVSIDFQLTFKKAWMRSMNQACDFGGSYVIYVFVQIPNHKADEHMLEELEIIWF